MIKSKIELPYNFFHIVLIGLILLILSFKYFYLSILFCIYLFLIRKNKNILILFICISFVCITLNLLQTKHTSNIFKGTVLTIEEKQYTNKLIVKVDSSKVIVYINKSFDIEVGDYGVFDCSISSFESNSYNGSFDYEEYLYNSYIDNVYFVNEYKFISKVFTITIIQNSIYNYLNNNLEDESLKYSLLLVLGIDTFSDEEEDVLSSLGIMHLFCISGMHINFLILYVSLILKKFKISDNKIEVVQICVALTLLIITNFSISVTRAFLMFFLAYIFKKNKINISSLDILSISALIILIFRPRYIYLVSFQLTYLVTFMIVITNDLYKNKNQVQTLALQSMIAFITTFPIIVNINYEINLLTIIYSTFISIPFSYLIMPITFITVITRSNFFIPIYSLFDNLLFDLSEYKVFSFSVARLNLLSIIFYYIISALLLKAIYLKKKQYRYIVILLMFLFLNINKATLNNVTTVTFFNVGQGDSSLISLPYNKGNILIDAYGGVSDYIKTRGIKTIDYVIITHAHNDHMGDLDEVQKEFNVKNLICSYYDPDSKKLNATRYVQAYDIIYIDNIIISFIAPFESNSDINLTSLVFTLTINDMTFLYTGDTTVEVESQMIEKNMELKADVLKVPHHGSSTSSSYKFIQAVDPIYSIFSYGKVNNYGLPNKEIVSRYYNTISYHTPIDGHIEFYYKKEWNVRFYN